MYKNKKCCCKMCKAHKRGWAHRWKEKDKDALKRFARAVVKKKFDELEGDMA